MAERRSGGGQGTARLALIVAFLALAVAWAAYRRQGGELSTVWGDLTRGGGGRTRATAGGDEGVAAWLERAEERLRQGRTEVAAQGDLRRVRREVADLRARLENASRGAGARARARWRQLDAELEGLEEQLRQGSSRALSTLDSVLAKIRREREDEQRP